MNSDKDIYFPFSPSISSSTPSLFSAQSVTNNSYQFGNNIDSSSELLKGFTTMSSQGHHDQSPSLGFMQQSNFAVDQPHGFGFGYNIPSNFIFSPAAQTQNALFQYPLQLNSTTTTPIIGLNNSLLKVVPIYQYVPKLPLPSLPVRIDGGLIGKNNKDLDDGVSKEKGTSNSISTVDGNGGSNNIQKPAATRRKRYNKRARNTFGERSSIYRGVSRYTGRYESFLWDNTNPNVKSRTVYVGGFEKEEEAAKAYDLAALKFWGKSAPLNFPISEYKKELEEMEYMTKAEYLLTIRRRSKGFAKGMSGFRGVSRNSDGKKWQARLGKGKGIRGIYLGTFGTEEEAAKAYDVAVLRMKGGHAVTNFDLNHYDIKNILESKKLPIGKGASKLLKMTEVDEVLQSKRRTPHDKKKSPAPQPQLDTSRDQIVTKPTNPQDQSMLDSLTSPIGSETPNDVSQKVLDNQNPSSSLFQYVHQNYPEVQNSYLNSSYGMIGSSAPALGFQVGSVSEPHSAALETDESSGSNGTWKIDDQYRQLSSQASEGHELENFQFFENQMFDYQPNRSFPTVNGASQNPNNQLQRNPSFLHLLAGDGSINTNFGYPSASYWKNNDKDDQGILKIATEAGKSSNLANIYGKEVQQMGTSEYHDFHEFLLENNDTDLQNLLQNPNYSFFPH